VEHELVDTRPEPIKACGIDLLQTWSME
jgi:hypothetical protein